MSHRRGLDRNQTQVLPACIEDYVSAEAPVRFIEAFAENLDLKGLGFQKTETAGTGRPPFHPADLLKLYLYGYLNRVRSSRRLEGEAGRNLEVIWLLRGERPDFKTIADFRKDHRKCFAGVFKDFNLICRKLDLFGAELVAIDGAKFKAANNSRRHYTKAQLEELLAKIDQRIEEYLGQMDQQDAEAEGVAGRPTAEQLKGKIEALQGRAAKYNQLAQEMALEKKEEISLTDPDSRGMLKVGVGYNVQVAVDAKHDLIVESQVVQQANDYGQLGGMAIAAKEHLEVEHLKVVADAGYHEADQIERCENNQIQTYVPARGSVSGQKNGQKIFPKEAFCYDGAEDRYRCPGGAKLPWVGLKMDHNKQKAIYYHVKACTKCPLKKQCTTGRYRYLSRLLNEAVIQRQADRVAANKDIVRERKTIVEHVFGTMRNWGHDEFLMKGLEKVRAEFSLSSLVYNLRRVLGLTDLASWLKAIKSSPMAC